MEKKLKITQVKSLIGSPEKHKRTMKAIGFHHNYETLIKKDSPQLRGMLHQVRHMVEVEEIKTKKKSAKAVEK
jgi:large subunit ribosomal protein L30